MVLALAALGLTGAASGVNGSTSPTASTNTSGAVAATISIDPLLVTLSLKAGTAHVGQGDPATTTIVNHGRTTLVSVTAFISAPSSVVVNPAGTQALGSLAAGAAKTARSALCGTVPGTYLVVAKAAAQDAVGHKFVGFSQPQRLVVTNSTGKC